MEALRVADANLVVYVHPSKAKNVSDAILRELSSLLFKFDERLDGVVLAYDPQVSSNMAKILPGLQPYFGVNLKAKLLLFNPKHDLLIEGSVIQLCEQSIHLIVLGFSSAIIISEDIREEFKYKTKHGKEAYISQSHKKHKIEVGTIIRFSVKSFDQDHLHISGSLLPAHTGSVRWLERNPDKWSEVESTAEKRKVGEIDSGKQELDIITGGKVADSKVKKSKKGKSGDS